MTRLLLELTRRQSHSSRLWSKRLSVLKKHVRGNRTNIWHSKALASICNACKLQMACDRCSFSPCRYMHRRCHRNIYTLAHSTNREVAPHELSAICYKLARLLHLSKFCLNWPKSYVSIYFPIVRYCLPLTGKYEQILRSLPKLRDRASPVWRSVMDFF